MNANLRQQLVNLTGLGVALIAWTLIAVYFGPVPAGTSPWVFFLQLTVNGLILGSLYALIALGYTMIYGVLKLLNFAHGDVYMIGSFIGFGVLTVLGGPLSPAIPVVLLVLCMFSVAMIGSGLLGLAIERFAYRPLRDAPRIAPLISALGVAFFLENSALLLFGTSYRNYDGFTLVSYDGLHLGGDARRVRPVPRTDRLRHGRRPHGRAGRARPLDAARESDPRCLVRPGGSGNDGDRHRPRDRRHFLH